MLLYAPTPSCPVWLHTAAMSLSFWEQYRVSLWVGRLRGPGWFRSDGRRKLLQEIPNCQTPALIQSNIQSTVFLSPTRAAKAPVQAKQPSTALTALPELQMQQTAQLCVQSSILRYDSLYA